MSSSVRSVLARQSRRRVSLNARNNTVVRAPVVLSRGFASAHHHEEHHDEANEGVYPKEGAFWHDFVLEVYALN